MATHQNPEFYREVDKYRHQRGCLSFGLIIFLVLVAIAGVAWFLLKRGWL